VADLIALLQGGGQNSVSAVIADLTAVAQAAGTHSNGLATLLTDLQTAAAPASAAPAAASAPVNSAPAAPLATADAGKAEADGQVASDVHHSPIAEMAHQFHHMWG
jgi:hypothetical protein